MSPERVAVITDMLRAAGVPDRVVYMVAAALGPNPGFNGTLLRQAVERGALVTPFGGGYYTVILRSDNARLVRPDTWWTLGASDSAEGAQWSDWVVFARRILEIEAVRAAREETRAARVAKAMAKRVEEEFDRRARRLSSGRGEEKL